MKEKDKKIKFKKWYLMPIFIFAFLCVFGFSIVKPVKAEYYTQMPTEIANTQYAFDVQVDFDAGGSYVYMFPQELYNYTESTNSHKINSSIAVFDEVNGNSIDYGYIAQNHFFQNSSSVYDFLKYQSEMHFISLFTNYDTYMTFINDEFVFIPSGASGYSNFDFVSMPYFTSSIEIANDVNQNQYLKLVSCEFDVVYLTIGTNGVEEVSVPFTYEFEENSDNTYDNVDFYSSWGENSYPIIYQSTRYLGAAFFPYRLVDYLLQDNTFLHFQDMLLIRNFKIFTYIAPRTQVTGIDKILTLVTPVTKMTDVPFTSIDYKNENYSIELLNANITPSQWGQIQFSRLKPTEVDIDFDFTSWLITAVGSFMNAELFPGFAIGGIFAVIVAFPLVIWFLKIVLGG